jgi:hypothetical protein
VKTSAVWNEYGTPKNVRRPEAVGYPFAYFKSRSGED